MTKCIHCDCVDSRNVTGYNIITMIGGEYREIIHHHCKNCSTQWHTDFKTGYPINMTEKAEKKTDYFLERMIKLSLSGM